MKIRLFAATLLFFLLPAAFVAGADFNGDGTADPAVFRSSSGLWAVRGITRVYFGSSGDTPVPGVYDSRLEDVPAVFRDSTGLWAVRGVTRVYFGSAGDAAVPGDISGDRTDEMGIFRPTSGLWAFRGITRTYFGSASDEAIPLGKGARRGELPVTGQTQTWITGDDGWVESGSAFCFQTFSIGGDLVTLDRNTGLMWASDRYQKGCCYGEQTDWDTAIDWCNSITFAGYGDWRLPNIKELQSICNYRMTYPAVDDNYFPNTRSGIYWSSTNGTNLPATAAFDIHFSDGQVESRDKPNNGSLRAVRGP